MKSSAIEKRLIRSIKDQKVLGTGKVPLLHECVLVAANDMKCAPYKTNFESIPLDANANYCDRNEATLCQNSVCVMYLLMYVACLGLVARDNGLRVGARANLIALDTCRQKPLRLEYPAKA
jgi:hypothetical protein